MITIKEIDNNYKKSEITETILRQLPEWFGIEESILDYIESVKEKKFYAAYDKNSVVGFICLKFNNKYTAEIYVMGVLKQYHGKGIGRQLVSLSEKYLLDNEYKFFMVKTLGESSDYEFYKQTRKFYSSIGFYPLEEIKEIWNENNPCLIMVKSINND